MWVISQEAQRNLKYRRENYSVLKAYTQFPKLRELVSLKHCASMEKANKYSSSLTTLSTKFGKQKNFSVRLSLILAMKNIEVKEIAHN